MRKIIIRVINIVLVMAFVFLSIPQKIYALETINVGFIDYKGFIEKDGEGSYSGYAVDYLDEISKYTQWKYNYIFDSWDQCLEKLEKGEIDILCSAQYTKERDELFDYSQYAIGNEFTIIYTRLNETIYFNDFKAMNNKTIGLLKDSYQNQSLKKYAQDNQFQYQEKYYDSEEEVMNALSTHEVDMIAVGSLALHDNVKVVAKFDPQPFYITVREGNQRLLDMVNSSLKQIRNDSPYFEIGLYNKYYSSSAYSTQPLFTREEVEYVQKQDVIQVGIYEDMFPFSYLDDNHQHKGLLLNLINKISEKSGLQFEYNSFHTKKELINQLNNKNYLFCGAIKDSKDIIRGNYWSSHSLLDVEQLLVSRKDANIDSFNDSTLALIFPLESIGQQILKDYPKVNLQYHSSIESCLEAVENGQADFTIYNTYTVNYLIQKPKFSDALSVHSLDIDPISICITANDNIDETLTSILNKSIESFSKNELSKVLYEYTIGFRYEYTLQDNLYLYRASIITGVFIIVLIGFIMYFFNKRHTQYLVDKKEADVLRRKVETDLLTGLYNYETFLAKVKDMLLKSSEKYYILYIDIDRFKIVNELYGMERGDELLAYIGNQLHQIENKYSDVVACHFTADKFFVLAPCSSYEKFNKLDILKDFHIEMDLTLRCGIYFITDQDIAVNLMCDRAALASQDVKGNYFKKLGIYDDEKRLKILREQEIIDDMEAAIQDQQMFIVIQPKYDIMHKKIIGGEALVRWNHPTKGYIPPNEFIPVIESNGYVIQMDYYVWEQTCQFMQYMKSQGIHLPISVNVSRLNFYRPHFCELLLELVHKYDIEPSQLQLEITESIYSEDTDFICSVIKELQSYGFIILMDDFGSGYSSLNMLKDAPVDIIKLDMLFLAATGEVERSRAIIVAVVNLARTLNMPLIVEGVETQDQVDFLNSIHVKYIQGYYFSKPLMKEAFMKLCEKE